jgi:hypothetical protein
MPASTLSKDSKVYDMQLEQKELLLEIKPQDGTASDSSIVSISGSPAARVIIVDLKEPVKSLQKIQVIDKATGQSLPLSVAPEVSGNTVSVTINGTGVADACISISYK